ncbi:MAG: SDR family oxidoreductase [Beijerinckiaceae bacterium]|nr:SDR family oxidoreductase [Beijerinckiaceae bacterium]
MIDTAHAMAAGARRLRDKICMVTGAGQGIGRATAYRFAAEGAHVLVVERNAESGAETARAIEASGGIATAYAVDMSVRADVENLMNACVQTFGRIDVLSNVVGGTIWWQPFVDYTEDQILQELQRSLYTTIWCCQSVLPHMIERKAGSIINFGSSVTKGGLYRVPYAISKGGIEAMTRTLAAENGRYGIRVNCLSPGTTIIADRSTSRLLLKEGEVAQPVDGTDERVDEARKARKPILGRPGRPEEQAAVAAFLASEDSSFITGHVIPVDGGLF